MERLLTVEFGPSRSKRFGKALAEARSRAGECTEVEPGRYRASFVLGEDAAAYAVLASLLERVRHWRATDVYEEDEPVSTYHAKEMAWCASSQLKAHGACRFRFYYGVFPRCSPCPLFDGERAIRDILGENPRDPSRTSRSRTSRQRSGRNPRLKNHWTERPLRPAEPFAGKVLSGSSPCSRDSGTAATRSNGFTRARRTIVERLELPCRSRDGVRG